MISGSAGMGVLMLLVYVLGEEAETAIPGFIVAPTNNKAVGLPCSNAGQSNSRACEATAMGNGGTRGEWKMDRTSQAACQSIAQPVDRIDATSPAAGSGSRFEFRWVGSVVCRKGHGRRGRTVIRPATEWVTGR